MKRTERPKTPEQIVLDWLIADMIETLGPAKVRELLMPDEFIRAKQRWHQRRARAERAAVIRKVSESSLGNNE